MYKPNNNHNLNTHADDIDLVIPVPGINRLDKNILLLKKGQGTMKKGIYNTRNIIDGDVVKDCRSILFLHAISGCDTTSAFYGKIDFQDMINVFNNPDASHEEVEKARERYYYLVWG
ncbi:hypothetical protein EVAR_40658_1 [Eumeta japonica]|uniref:Uncharacterized protein n=1 Tax=Eumeta variegata TaxID=151549 RepID=A0A4C1X6Y4_EUMVA|nr:hypothetical protein EVAR_40658_1 [Eumeta japonica]